MPKKKETAPDFPIIVTSYEIVMNDRKYLQRYNWKYIVVDEGHRIKNLNCRLIKELKSYSSANRLLLTGTPLQVSQQRQFIEVSRRVAKPANYTRTTWLNYGVCSTFYFLISLMTLTCFNHGNNLFLFLHRD